MDYIADVNGLSDDELNEVMDDLFNVLGVDRNGTFRDFFIKFMGIYAKSSFGFCPSGTECCLNQ